MNIKPDDKLAVCVRSMAGNEGRIFEVLGFAGNKDNGLMGVGPAWFVSALDGKPIKWTLHSLGEYLSDSVLKAIRDQPGNEQFVVEARKSLPRPKPATTKGDTITERGLVEGPANV